MTAEKGETPRKEITPLDPDSPAGKAAAEALSQALAEIYVAIDRRRRERLWRESATD
ncbi:hypothetical protein AB0J20_18250 [Micromonospora costi]|uniref:hypothetical protein n=1 Tax=Micromonospora costi TaxID=1530042 RepID=UPI003411BAF1